MIDYTCDHIDIIIDDISALFIKKGRPSNDQYLLIAKRLHHLKKVLLEAELASISND